MCAAEQAQLFILCFISLDAYNTLLKYIIGKWSDSNKFKQWGRKKSLQASPGSFICTRLPPRARTGTPRWWTPQKGTHRTASSSANTIKQSSCIYCFLAFSTATPAFFFRVRREIDLWGLVLAITLIVVLRASYSLGRNPSPMFLSVPNVWFHF